MASSPNAPPGPTPAPHRPDEPLRVFLSSTSVDLEPDPGRPRYILTESGIGYRLRGATRMGTCTLPH